MSLIMHPPATTSKTNCAHLEIQDREFNDDDDHRPENAIAPISASFYTFGCVFALLLGGGTFAVHDLKGQPMLSVYAGLVWTISFADMYAGSAYTAQNCPCATSGQCTCQVCKLAGAMAGCGALGTICATVAIVVLVRFRNDARSINLASGLLWLGLALEFGLAQSVQTWILVDYDNTDGHQSWWTKCSQWTQVVAGLAYCAFAGAAATLALLEFGLTVTCTRQSPPAITTPGPPLGTAMPPSTAHRRCRSQRRHRCPHSWHLAQCSHHHPSQDRTKSKPRPAQTSATPAGSRSSPRPRSSAPAVATRSMHPGAPGSTNDQE